MAHLISGYITAEKLRTILETLEKKGEKGFGFTVAVNDETDSYGNNVQFHASQTKEQREAKEKKWYFGNGKVFWTNGTEVKIAQKVEKPQQNLPPAGSDGLPF